MKSYVVGIGETENDKIVLIRKNRPVRQADKFNFPGGKVEPGETGPEAIAREWREETGVETTPDSWHFVGHMVRENDFIVWIYHQINHRFKDCRTMTDEGIFLFTGLDFERDPMIYENIMPNCVWLYHYVHGQDYIDYGTRIHMIFPDKPEGESDYGNQPNQ